MLLAAPAYIHLRAMPPAPQRERWLNHCLLNFDAPAKPSQRLTVR